MRRAFPGVLAGVIVALGVAGFASASAGATKPSLTIAAPGCGTETTSGSAGAEVYAFSANVVDLGYEPLIDQTAKLQDVPGLALKWKVAPGNKAITFWLRHGVRFSDGTAFDAQALVFWWKHILKETPLNNEFNLGPVAKTQVLGKYEARMTLKEPNPLLQYVFTRAAAGSEWTFPASPKATAKANANPKSNPMDTATYGAGPYMLSPKQTVFGDHCTWVPNPYFYDKTQVKWSKIIMRHVVDPTSAYTALQAGQVQVAYSDPSDAPAAKKAGFHVLTYANAEPEMFFLDHAGKLNPATADLRVRQALNYAINRKVIIDSLFGGALLNKPSSEPNMSPPNTVPDSDDNNPKIVNYYPYDPAKAKALLAAAGYGSGLKLNILCMGNAFGPSTNTQFCEAVAQELAAVGVTLEVTEPATYQDWNTDWTSHKYSMMSWMAGGGLSPIGWWGLTLGPAEQLFNDQHGSEQPQIVKLYNAALTKPYKQAMADFRKIADLEVTTAWTLPFGSNSDGPLLWSNKVGGIVGGPSYSDTDSLVLWYPKK